MNINKIEKATKIIEAIKKLDDLCIRMGKKLNDLSQGEEGVKMCFQFQKSNKGEIAIDAEEYTFSMFSRIVGHMTEKPRPQIDQMDIEISDVFTIELFGFIYNQAQREREKLVMKLEKLRV